MSAALQAARAKALAAVQRRKDAAAAACTTASDAATASAPATQDSSAVAAAAAAASDATVASPATTSDVSSPAVPPPRQARKRRFHLLLADGPDSAAAAATAAVTPAAFTASSAMSVDSAVSHASGAGLSIAADAADAAIAAAPLAAAPLQPSRRTRWSAPLSAPAASTAAAVTAIPALAAACLPTALDEAPPSSASSSALSASSTGHGAQLLALQAPVAAATTDASSSDSTALVLLGGTDGTIVPARRTRFEAPTFDAASLLKWHPTHLPPSFSIHAACKGLTTAQADAVLAHLRLEAIDAQLRLLAAGRPIDEVDPLPLDPQTLLPTRARSPSPEPVYDPQGIRTNTRPQRLRLHLLQLSKRLVTDTLARCTGGEFIPPRGWKSSAAGRFRFERKVLVPLDEYPDYNFKGVIIGARGLNQQELEKRTGCKIAVRGKGSQSENRPESMRAQHYHAESADEPQHVWIAAETEEALAAGVKEVEKLLVPMSEEARRASLRTLAELNGWVSEQPRLCLVCHSSEHLMRACPERNHGRGYTTAAHVSCKLCGARTHPTMDCPTARGWTRAQLLDRLRASAAAGAKGTLRDADERIDDDYEEFMAELFGGGTAADGGEGEGGNTSKCTRKSSLPSVSSSLVARGADGHQLALMAPAPATSREDHESAVQHAQLSALKEPSFREYTARTAAREAAAATGGWETHTFGALPLTGALMHAPQAVYAPHMMHPPPPPGMHPPHPPYVSVHPAPPAYPPPSYACAPPIPAYAPVPQHAFHAPYPRC